MRSTKLGLLFTMLALAACADDSAGEPPGSTTAKDQGIVRGRLSDTSGAALADVEVSAGGSKARTGADGRFELKVDRGAVRLAVDSDALSAAVLPVKVEREPANVEITVKRRKSLTLPDAKPGGRLEGDDGLVVELPAEALVDDLGAVVEGEVELRYALIQSPADVTAAPGRMQAEDSEGLDGYGLAELRFYAAGKRVKLAKEITVELPMHDAHGLAEGDVVNAYALGKQDSRWKGAAQATVSQNKLRMRTSQDEWLGGAKKLPVDSCVSGSLAVSTQKRAANTTIRAARARGLSLIQGETGSDGSFCLPVTPNDDWYVSTFHDDGADSYALSVELNSSDATGMCGGDGCKSVGDVALPKTAATR